MTVTNVPKREPFTVLNMLLNTPGRLLPVSLRLFLGAALFFYLFWIATYNGSLPLDTLLYLAVKFLPFGSDTCFGFALLTVTKLSLQLTLIF